MNCDQWSGERDIRKLRILIIGCFHLHRVVDDKYDLANSSTPIRQQAVTSRQITSPATMISHRIELDSTSFAVTESRISLGSSNSLKWQHHKYKRKWVELAVQGSWCDLSHEGKSGYKTMWRLRLATEVSSQAIVGLTARDQILRSVLFVRLANEHL